MSAIITLFAAFDQHRESILEEFFTLLRFPSISSEREFVADVRNCADWLVKYLRNIGMTVELWETTGHPVVYAEWLEAGTDKPTLLIYNHYDVQPVDPLSLWDSPPFEPTIRDGEIYARGAVDNKGQLFYVAAALQYLLKRDGKLPVNVKFVIEGEEEEGSEGLATLLPQKAERLKADSLVVVDVGFEHPESPAVVLGVRGIVAFELTATGSSSDLHSGVHGGIVYNPNRALAEILAKLHNAAGRVTVPGFYDGVTELSAAERAQYLFDFDADWYRKTFGAEATGGESNLSPLERRSLRPTLEINGMSGGYSGEGFKTVIPAKAIAKISCRLVPNQDPEKVATQVKDYLLSLAPAGISLEVKAMHAGRAVRSPADSSIAQVAREVFAEVCERPCRFALEGGSIPVASDLARAAKAEIALIGYGLPDDQIHAPNEHFGVDRLRKGFVTMVRLLEVLGERKSKGKSTN